jgi:hypothetical protein
MPGVVVELVDFSRLLNEVQDIFVAPVVQFLSSTRTSLPFKGPSSELLICLTEEWWVDVRLLETLLLNDSFEVFNGHLIVLLSADLDDTVVNLNFNFDYLVV